MEQCRLFRPYGEGKDAGVISGFAGVESNGVTAYDEIHFWHLSYLRPGKEAVL
jgi:hypothetical protein